MIQLSLLSQNLGIVYFLGKRSYLLVCHNFIPFPLHTNNPFGDFFITDPDHTLLLIATLAMYMPFMRSMQATPPLSVVHHGVFILLSFLY